MDEQIVTLDQAMQMAIDEAYKGAAQVSPNPKVGCVILNSKGQLISKGHHKKFGGPHAEIEALQNLKHEDLIEAHVIVTLEPCAHQGKTPSCAKKLASLPIKKVTYGLMDPNPLVAGQGHQILSDAGIEVEIYRGDLTEALENVCEEFLVNFREKRIFVAMKVAQSIDGQVALSNGVSQWITGPESRMHVQKIRSYYDAVLVGYETIIKDNPSLNIRLADINKENWAVILTNQKLSEDLKVFQVRPHEKVLTVSGDLKLVLQSLYDKGLRSILVEGGAFTFSEFLRQGLVDRMHVFTAPVIMGQGKSWSQSLSYPNLEIAPRAKKIDTQVFGPDIYTSFKLK